MTLIDKHPTIETKYGALDLREQRSEHVFMTDLKSGEQDKYFPLSEQVKDLAKCRHARLAFDLSRLIRANSSVDANQQKEVAWLEKVTGVAANKIEGQIFWKNFDGPREYPELETTVKVLQYLALELTLIATPMSGSSKTGDVRKAFTTRENYQKELAAFMKEMLKDTSIPELAKLLNLRETTVSDSLSGNVSTEVMLRIAAGLCYRIHVQVRKLSGKTFSHAANYRSNKGEEWEAGDFVKVLNDQVIAKYGIRPGYIAQIEQILCDDTKPNAEYRFVVMLLEKGTNRYNCVEHVFTANELQLERKHVPVKNAA